MVALIWAAPTLGQGRNWTVQSGDALSLLADRFGVTVDELRSWNRLTDDRIYVGQHLVVRERAAPGERYQVQPGDTVSAIATRFGVTVEQLTGWNADLDPDRIQVGQELQLGRARHRIHHRVRSGDTLLRIAQRYRVPLSQLRRWNPRVRRDVVREGQRLTVYSEVPESTSKSVGRPYQGRLEAGVQARRHRGYVLRDRGRAWGTHETVRWLAEGFDTVRRHHPRAPRVRVHDISRAEGGAFSGHRSHQSGRDVDISFFLRRGCTPQSGCPMVRANPHDLAIAPQWTLLQHWLERNQLEAVFIDYSLMEALYERAKATGATRAQLTRWFQYPRGRSGPGGILRHYRQHRDHIHVRFRCHDSDEGCR